MRILASQINPIIGDIEGNCHKILQVLKKAKERGVDIILFPELTLCGYFPDDLLLDRKLIKACVQKLEVIRELTKGLFVVVGLPRFNDSLKEKPLFNSAAILANGKLLGYQDKVLLPTYDVFDERRYFEPGREERVWEYSGQKIGVSICEDAWQHAGLLDGYTNYHRDPIAELGKSDLHLNMSASPYYFGRKNIRLTAFQKVAKSLKCPVVFCNQVGANDQLVFDGHSMVIDKDGELLQMAEGFVEEDLLIDFNKHKIPVHEPIADLYSALVLGVKDYFHKQGFKKALVGLSGGIDSALVTQIAKDALGAENVLAITMPSQFSSRGSVDDSVAFTKILRIPIKEISIEPIFKEYLTLLEPLFEKRKWDETEENLQSRIRGMILMAFSNKFGYLVLNTGNKSEMAMGYCTLYGDMAGGLGVLHDVKKTQVYELAKYVHLPEAIIHKTPSAELRENQIDFDTLPSYEVLDVIIESYVEKRMEPEEIASKIGKSFEFVEKIVRKIHQNEYKRRQAPIGIRVSEKAFSKGRVVPIVQKWT